MDDFEIRNIAQSIVSKAKATARVDQGRLKRSIAYTYVRGVVTFRQLYWGSFGDNSYLEELANEYMPRGVSYNVTLTELGGDTYEKGTTKQGRVTSKRAIASTSQTMTKRFLAMVKKKREKEDGEQTDE